MNLYEYMEAHQDIDELTVWDTDFDMETYFYPEDVLTPEYDWDKAMAVIAKKLEVVEEHAHGVTVNLWDTIKLNVEKNPTFNDLFIDNRTYPIMADMMAILAGGVSEEWLTDFANSLITVKKSS